MAAYNRITFISAPRLDSNVMISTAIYKDLYLCFRGWAFRLKWWQCCTTKRKEPEVENARWRPINLKYVLNLYTRLQRNSNGNTYVSEVEQHD